MRQPHPPTNPKAPDYQFHMPRPLTYPLPVAIFSVLLAALSYTLLREPMPRVAALLAGIPVLAGSVYVGVFALLKRLSNVERRLHARDKLLDGIPWRGDESVLDVGCGNGILILGAAQRLTTGKGIGIDIWTDGSGDNRPEAFDENANIEGVADRVSLHNADARQLPYANNSFDVVLSGLTMHHMGRAMDKAMVEMARVLKPGGWMAIYDEPSTVLYSAKLMRQHDLHIAKKTTDMVLGIKSHPVTFA